MLDSLSLNLCKFMEVIFKRFRSGIGSTDAYDKEKLNNS